VARNLWHRLTCDERDGPLAGLLIVLTVASGLIDGTTLLRLGHVFGAAMTGNLLFIGVALAGAPGFSVTTSLTALGAFVTGSFVAKLIIDHTSSDRGRLLRDAAAFQLAALAVSTIIVGAVGNTPGPGARYPLLALISAAMGVQMAAVRELGVREVTTTVLTTTLSTLIIDLHPSTWRAVSGQLRVLAILVEVLGAAVGALFVLNVATWTSLGLAAAVVATVVVLAHRGSRDEPAWSRPLAGA
jgi:uncharacterized membrane protein YoaK (UPF0700 family)